MFSRAFSVSRIATFGGLVGFWAFNTYPDGAMSSHIASLKEGEALEIRGPFKKLLFRTNMKKRIGMIAGGTGITPMLQILEHVLSDPNDKHEFSLIYANIAEDDILMRLRIEELQREAKKNGRIFDVFYVLEKPPKSWQYGVGYTSENDVQRYMPSPSDDSLILVCGPPGMMKAISGGKAKDYSQGELSGILKTLGYTK
eukprot:1110939_1